MKAIKFFIPFIFLLLLACNASAEYITPPKYSVTECIQQYYGNDAPNSYSVACEIGEFVSEKYCWNCDIRQVNFTNHTPIYINVFYPEAENKKGYTAYYGWFGFQSKEVTKFTGKDKKLYYTDWYEPGKECFISGVTSYGIVKSYYGNVTTSPENDIEYNYEVITGNDSDNNTCELENNDTEENYTEDNYTEDNYTEDNYTEDNYTEDNYTEDNYTEDNYTEENNTTDIIKYDTIEIERVNSVKNSGMIESIKQYIFDFSGANLQNFTLDFWS